MMYGISRRLGLPALAIAAAILTTPALAADEERAVVLGVHSQESSAAFEAKLGLPAGRAGNGRFVIVKLLGESAATNPYALVYAPPGLAIKKDDVVVLEPTAVNVVTHPGEGNVARIDRQTASIR